MRDAVIVDAVRTPIGKRRGSLSDIHPGDLTGHILNALVQRVGFDPSLIDDVVWGCVNQVGDQSANLGRLGVLAAGWPETVPGTTIDRKCGSSQQAVSFAAASVIAGHYDMAVAGGTESMTRVPMGSNVGEGQPYATSVLDRFKVERFNQGVGAELMSKKWGFSRAQLDEYSARSHQLTAAAADAGRFDSQIAPVAGLEHDEALRRGSSAETLSGLQPAFDPQGLITAGNSSQIADGASALLITTSEIAAARGWKPLVRVHTSAVVGDDPVMMLAGPLAATKKVLNRSGLHLDEIGAFEINEAFAPVPLAWQEEFGVADELLNPLGGAIAVGHPLGASGAILMTRLIHHMRDNDIRFGLQSMCEAGGMANATVLELI